MGGTMNRLALALLAACGGLPGPGTPLVTTPLTGRPPVPSVAEVAAPSFPRVSARTGGGGTLWYVPTAAHRDVLVRVQTRRGEDGAHPRGLTDLTATILAEELNAVLGPVRARGGADVHGAYLEVRSEGEGLDSALAAIARVLDGPPPSVQRVQRAREVALHHIRASAASPHAGAIASALAQLHGRPADIDDGVRAWEEIYRSFDADLVDACRIERFAADERVVIISGEFEVSTVRESFERHFGAERPSVVRLAARPPEITPPLNSALSRPMDEPQAYVLFARPAPEPSADDRLPFEMIVDLLGGTFTSRLNGSLREAHAYTYGAHAFISAREDSDVLFIRSAFTPVDVRAALEDLFRHLREMRERPFTDEEVAAARDRVWTRIQAAVEGLGLPGVLGHAWVMHMVPAELESRYAALAQVTPQHLHEIAQRRFAPHEGLLVITGDFARVGGFIVERNPTGFTLRN